MEYFHLSHMNATRITNMLVLSCMLFLWALPSIAQQKEKEWPFDIRLETVEINEFPALQSFAYASWEGKWLLLGGRKDGLHRRQPWASFNEEGQNDQLYVVDPLTKQVWKQSLQQLPAGIREQLQSTNMEFYQIENTLVLTGGYGYSKTIDNHATFPYLTIVHVEQLVTAILKKQPIASAFVQIRDERMAITGGRLGKLGDTLILVGGQRFDGMYNPMGPDHGPGFEQVYSNEIRKFRIAYENNLPVITDYHAIRDTINLHRRDYNLVPQVFQQTEAGYTVFSGVFQYDKDLPYTNFVDINNGHYRVNNDFQQKLSHYHSAVLPLYDETTGNMHTLFFGGIARYYPDQNGNIIANDEVPFTKTISMVTRKNEDSKESYLPVQMPGYLGAAAEFIFAPGISLYREGIAAAADITHAEKLIGYITGGINSSEKNIFWTNNGKESKAENKIIKVFLTRKNK